MKNKNWILCKSFKLYIKFIGIMEYFSRKNFFLNLGECLWLNKGVVFLIFLFVFFLFSNDFLNDESFRCLRKKNREGMFVIND